MKMPSAQGYDGLESNASCEAVGPDRLHAWQVSRVRDVALVEKPSVPTTPAEKVNLFRSLFRGREDVFPIRFVSKKTGKPGYAPACANKFVRGVCELPRIKCGECPNQAFLRTDDEAVLDHLRGRHVMGAYPLLEDETCWLLAADFDKASWKDDVSAFIDMCRSGGVPVAVERSRSGNGAHAWFFFAAPIPAVVAREVGCYLLTETMAHRHQLSVEFYKKQSLRLSTAMTPRVIACAEEFSQHISLPRGCRADLEELLEEHGVALVVDDQRHEGEAVSVQFQGELTAVQEQAARALLQHDIGVLVAPPGIGKTVLGTYLIAERGRSTLVLVHRRPLLDQ